CRCRSWVAPSRPRGPGCLARCSLTPGLRYHILHALEFILANLFRAQQTQDQLISGAVKDAFEKPGGALIAAEARAVHEGPPFQAMPHQAFVLHDAQQGLYGIVGDLLIALLPRRQLALHDANTARSHFPEDLE